jgi:hypothetical protein
MHPRPLRIPAVAAIAAAAFALAVSAGGSAGAGTTVLNGPSPVVGIRYYLAHPKAAPPALRAQFLAAHAAVQQAAGSASSAGPVATVANVFNRDTDGLPQNEEAVSACTANPHLVISGTNDYRGILDPQGDFTGWYFSNDGGQTLTNEGLLPPVRSSAGDLVPSGGDPTFAISADCKAAYGASINYGNGNLGETPSIEAVYRSTPQRLTSCPQGGSGGTLTHPACWPTRIAVATAAPGHFIDKDWLATSSGPGGDYVWVAFDDLSQFNSEGNEESGVVEIVRCSADLSSCTKPIPLSGGQKVAEYPTVTVDRGGRVYVTWGEFFGDSFIGPAQRGWVAVADPGSLSFTKHPIVKENQVIRAQETLHANSFRVGTMFKNTVTMVHGKPVILATWDRCKLHVVDQFCEEAEIRVSTSSDLGSTWSTPRTISAGGDNIFPYLDTDPVTQQVVGVWYTSRFDPVFHNRQDVELVRLSAAGVVQHRTRVTKVSNETEADPILGSAFIGDYIQVDAVAGTAYVAYNANLRHVRLLGQGVPIPQQDNYLVRVPE